MLQKLRGCFHTQPGEVLKQQWPPPFMMMEVSRVLANSEPSGAPFFWGSLCTNASTIV
jgi:hypothetical protein